MLFTGFQCLKKCRNRQSQSIALLLPETATENQNKGFNTIIRSKHPRALESATWMKFQKTTQSSEFPLEEIADLGKEAQLTGFRGASPVAPRPGGGHGRTRPPGPRISGTRAAPARPSPPAPGVPKPSHSAPAPARAGEDVPLVTPDPAAAHLAGTGSE